MGIIKNTGVRQMSERLEKFIDKNKDNYTSYLKMDYEHFYNATNFPTSDGGGYTYCGGKERDSESSRLSYIMYLVQDKGYDL